MDNNIKLIRLRSGEDVMANYTEFTSEQKVLLSKPMHVIFRRIATGQNVMLMMPWLPIELIKENTAQLCASEVLTVIDPREDFIDYYLDIVREADDRMQDGGFNQFESADDEEEDEEDFEITDEEVEHILKEKKNNRLH